MTCHNYAGDVVDHPPPTHTHTQVFGLFEELLSSRFPYSSYKIVFLDHTYQSTASYSTLSLFR